MAARKDLAASLADMGAIPPSYLTAMRGTERNGDALTSTEHIRLNRKILAMMIVAISSPGIALPRTGDADAA